MSFNTNEKLKGVRAIMIAEPTVTESLLRGLTNRSDINKLLAKTHN